LLLLRRPVVTHSCNQRQVAACRPRHKSSSSRSTSNSNSSTAEKNVFQEKTDRATQLHHELEGLMHNHHTRIKEEQSRPAYEGFFSFIRRNKGEMINIGAGFVCTMLAYQIVGLSKYSQKLEGQLQEHKEALEEKRTLLVSLSSPDFVQRVAQECKEAISEDAQPSSWFGGVRATQDQQGESRNATPSILDEISKTLGQALRKRIGDAGLSEEQKRDQIMTKLQQAQDELVKTSQRQEDGEALNFMALTDENEVEIVEDSSSGATIVKKRRFAI